MDRTVGDWHTCSALKVVGIYDVLQCSRTHFTSHQQTHKKPVRTRHCLSVNGPFQTWRLGPAHGAACGPTTTHRKLSVSFFLQVVLQKCTPTSVKDD